MMESAEVQMNHEYDESLCVVRCATIAVPDVERMKEVSQLVWP